MKIVQFKDGTFGIRKLTLTGYKLLDLVDFKAANGRQLNWRPIRKDRVVDCYHEDYDYVKNTLKTYREYTKRLDVGSVYKPKN